MWQQQKITSEFNFAPFWRVFVTNTLYRTIKLSFVCRAGRILFLLVEPFFAGCLLMMASEYFPIVWRQHF